MTPGLRITDAYAITAAGTGVAAALGAVATGAAATRRHKSVELPDPKGELQPVYYAPALDHDVLVGREQSLLTTLLDDMAPEAATSTAALPGDEPFWLMTAGDEAPYRARFNAEELSNRLTEAGANPQRVAGDHGGTPVLKQLHEALIQRGQSAAWLMGVDSRIAPRRMRQIAQHQDLQYQGSPGMIPSEAAAAVRLELGSSDDDALAISAAASAAEPATEPRHERVSGLPTAVTQALEASGEDPKSLGYWFSDDIATVDGERQRWQCVQQVWPTRIDERQQRAIAMGFLKRGEVHHNEPPHQHTPAILGHVGAASLPLQLALAARRRRWRQRRRVYRLASEPAPTLITENPLTGYRHAVVMTA